MNSSPGRNAVEVRLYGALRRYRPAGLPGAPHHPFPFPLPPDRTVAGIVSVLGIPDGLVHAAAVNGEATTLASVVEDGDSVALFPPTAGG